MNTLEKLHPKLVNPLVHCRIEQSLTTVLSYKSLVRPHLDYGDAIFDKAYNNSLQQRLESLQYKASLVITGADKGSSTERDFIKS